MNDFKSLLQEFDTTLQECNLINYNKLQPPLSNNKIEELCKELNIDNEDFKLLYQWKNGVNLFDNNLEQCAIVKWGTLISLENILEFNSTKLWSNDFKPFISNYNGEFYLFNNKKGKDYGKIFLYSVALTHIKPISYFDSVYHMIKTNLNAYQKKIIHYIENENWLEIKPKEFGLIASAINPNSGYWKIK